LSPKNITKKSHSNKNEAFIKNLVEINKKNLIISIRKEKWKKKK